MAIIVPKTITAGFQKRRETYEGKLAYIIYTDEKGVLRKEKSWNSWRNKEIDSQTFDNIPTEGFVLNKKTGGYSTGWNHRQTYVRVYDPRGLEFEITVPNLLYILENSNSIKGKGLEGEFIYAWDGADLLLMPTSSPDYKEIMEFSKKVQENNTFSAKDLKIGATYLSKDAKEYVYMGYFPYYNWNDKKTKRHFFAELKPTLNHLDKEFENTSHLFLSVSAPKSKFISLVDENSHPNYAEFFNKLERSYNYSPIDETKNEYVPYTREGFSKLFEGYLYKDVFVTNYELGFSNQKTTLRRENIDIKGTEGLFILQFHGSNHRYSNGELKKYTFDELFNELSPCYLNTYLENGKLYKTSRW